MIRRILIAIVVIILVWAGVWYFYVRPKQNAGTPLPTVVNSFFPKAITTSINILGGNTTPDITDTTPAAANPLQQITGRPIAGYTIFSLSNTVSVPSTDPKVKPTVQTTTDHYIRYVSRSNGYVYEIKNGTTALQVSNVFIPNIYEAFFADNNNTALLRFLRQNTDTIATYSVPIPPLNADNTRTQKAGIYLPDNISALTVSPDQKSVLRIINENNGVAVSTSTTTGTIIKTVLRSPFTSWLPQWTISGMYLQTKAASVTSGFLYSIDQSSARLRRIVGDVAGMTTSVSPKGTYVLYSESTNGGFTTKLFNTKTNSISPINLAILPEKCTWLQNEDLMCAGNNNIQNATYPDAWYAGTMHFSDQLYQIATASNTYTIIYNDVAQSFDMTNLQIDEGQRLIYFVDKNTGLLWQYKY